MSFNFYWQLAINKNGLDLHTFIFLTKVVLAKIVKVTINPSKLKVIAPKSNSSEIARLELPT